MKILIITPLYPPDTALSAQYVKELATRLSATNSIEILTYGNIPEKIDGVTIYAINKNAPLLLRLGRFFTTLIKLSKNTNVLFVENGASVELPVGLMSMLRRRMLIFHIGDKNGQQRIEQSLRLSRIQGLVKKRAHHILEEMPTKKPEIIPLEKFPEEAMNKYEKGWELHVSKINQLIAHGKG